MPRGRTGLLVGLTAALALAGCTTGSTGSAPTWVPSPDFETAGEGPDAVQNTPIVPIPSLAPQGNGGSAQGAPSGGASSSSPSGTTDPDVVATHLSSPVGLTMLPDNTALVGERTTGQIVQVQPVAGQPVPVVKTLHGLDVSGGGGLLDLALSPTYAEDSLIYAYITTPKDNRVVDFTLDGPVTPVVTGIPRGSTGNAGRITFGADGDLYIGTGDAGNPALAANPASLAGKVLRYSDIGGAAPGNPTAGSPVWTGGHLAVDGLCIVGQTTSIVEVEADDVNVLRAGATYGRTGDTSSSATLPAADRDAGGCAVQDGVLYVTSLDGRALLSSRTKTSASSIGFGSFTKLLVGKYGRLRTVVAADDGALWLTTSNRDGHGSPVPTDERVIRYQPPSGGGGSNPA